MSDTHLGLFERYLWLVFSTLAIFCLVVLFVKFFVFDFGTVEGISMVPTRQNGDTFFVNKIIFLIKPPERGDVAEIIETNNKLLIKRIIGLPGENIIFEGDKIYIQKTGGEKKLLSEPYISHDIIAGKNNRSEPIIFSMNADEYFVMGDNRDFSFDSRNYGPIHRSDIVGKVE